MPPNLPPLGLRREAAAEFVTVSPTKFDEMVRDGRMPQPIHIDGIVAWDVEQLKAHWRRIVDDQQQDSEDVVKRIDRKLGLTP